METAQFNEHINQSLKAKFGDLYKAFEMSYDFPVYTIDKSAVVEVLNFLKLDAEINCNFLSTLCAVHVPDQLGSEFGMVYHLHNLQENKRIRVKAWLSKEDLHIDSICSIWPSANWMERQEYDFFGVKFTGHPDLRRILNMDEMNYYPLRKEYPLEDGSRDDKNDKMFGR